MASTVKNRRPALLLPLRPRHQSPRNHINRVLRARAVRMSDGWGNNRTRISGGWGNVRISSDIESPNQPFLHVRSDHGRNCFGRIGSRNVRWCSRFTNCCQYQCESKINVALVPVRTKADGLFDQLKSRRRFAEAVLQNRTCARSNDWPEKTVALWPVQI